MSEPFIAEIKIWAGNFAPRGYAFCDGQLLPIAQNTALFSLIGTTYGGDGRTTTALPNLQGRAPMHPGTGPGLTARRLGQKIGAETTTLTEAQMADHTHTLRATVSRGAASTPQGNAFNRSVGENAYSTPASLTGMASAMAPPAGGGQAHDNMQPFLTLSFIIALQGLYPTRS
jgi:microcystin-dependent protein